MSSLDVARRRQGPPRGPAGARRHELMSHEEANEAFPPLSEEKMRAADERLERLHNPKAAAKKADAAAATAAKAEDEKRATERQGRRQNVSQVRSTGGRAARNGLRLIEGGKLNDKGPGGTVAGVALGLVATAIAVNIFRYGPAGVGYWLSAKFLNKVIVPGSSSPATPAKPASASGPSPSSSSQGAYQIPGQPGSAA